MRAITEYRHVLWDFNGTVLNDLELCLQIQRDMLSSRGLPPISRERYLDTFTFPIKNWYADMGYDVSDYDNTAQEWNVAYNSHAPACGLNNGFLRLSDTLRRHGIGQSILSACQQELLNSLLDNLDIADRFEHIYGQNNVLGESKINLGAALVKRLGTASGRLLMIGDTLHDLSCAHAIGCDCALVSVGHQSHERLASRWPDVFPSFSDLLRTLLPR